MTKAELQSIADDKAQEYGIPPELFRAMITQESGWNPRIVSNKGAAGLGQLMPGTAAGLGVKDRFDPEANLDGSARYLKAQYDRFGSWELALAAYNAGPAAVQKAGDQIPKIRETQNYVSSIMGGLGESLASPPGERGRTAPGSIPWWLDGDQVDALHRQLGLDQPPAAGKPSPPIPWWLDGDQVDQLHRQLGLTPETSEAPTSSPTPSPTLTLPQAPPGPGLRQQIQASFPGPIALPAPSAPPAPTPPAAPSLSQTLLAGNFAGPGGNAAQAGAGLTRAQVALPPQAPAATSTLSPATSLRVQQIQGSATGPLAQAIQQYAARTGGRSYIGDLVTRAQLAPNPAMREAVLQEAQAYGLRDAVQQLATSA